MQKTEQFQTALVRLLAAIEARPQQTVHTLDQLLPRHARPNTCVTASHAWPSCSQAQADAWLHPNCVPTGLAARCVRPRAADAVGLRLRFATGATRPAGRVLPQRSASGAKARLKTGWSKQLVGQVDQIAAQFLIEGTTPSLQLADPRCASVLPRSRGRATGPSPDQSRRIPHRPGGRGLGTHPLAAGAPGFGVQAFPGRPMVLERVGVWACSNNATRSSTACKAAYARFSRRAA